MGHVSWDILYNTFIYMCLSQQPYEQVHLNHHFIDEMTEAQWGKIAQSYTIKK